MGIDKGPRKTNGATESQRLFRMFRCNSEEDWILCCSLPVKLPPQLSWSFKVCTTDPASICGYFPLRNSLLLYFKTRHSLTHTQHKLIWVGAVEYRLLGYWIAGLVYLLDALGGGGQWLPLPWRCDLMLSHWFSVFVALSTVVVGGCVFILFPGVVAAAGAIDLVASTKLHLFGSGDGDSLRC